ncbi:unannotated protein [freshwater metagenome]|uniref:Unannotated protein n=1 Tax=freshwater metagenome TaxID=449393 RepID=A0A6J7KTM6_9ZZZZ
MRIGFVGCVKGKADRPMPAQELYTSSLFIKRRKFVEESCDSWWILSAEHGLVSPNEILAPYDRALKDTTLLEKRLWSAQVLDAVALRISVEPGAIAELHAGKEYRDFGLCSGLLEASWRIENPTEGMRIGAQLQFYARALNHE